MRLIVIAEDVPIEAIKYFDYVFHYKNRHYTLIKCRAFPLSDSKEFNLDEFITFCDKIREYEKISSEIRLMVS